MAQRFYPTINPEATGRNIRNLRMERGLSIEDLQDFFGFSEPRSIYKWQSGQCLPSIDNLYALSALFEVPMDSIIAGTKRENTPIAPNREAMGVCLFPYADAPWVSAASVFLWILSQSISSAVLVIATASTSIHAPA